MRVNKGHKAYMKDETYKFHVKIPANKSGFTVVSEITLPNGKKITLNEQQVGALEAMKAWLADKEDLFFTLSGYAGTGKSTIVLELIKYFKGENRWKRVAVSAPTHKAKKVIARTTKEDSFTIQKLLGLRPNTELENFDINNPQFDERAEKEIRNFKLLIIDEASMLNSSLFDLIVKEAKLHRTKVLFMGDEAQLPPVNESISKIFTQITTKAHLTKVERQKDSNPLMGVYDLIRSDIKSQEDLFEHKTHTNPRTGEGIIFHADQGAFERDILPMFGSMEYQKDSDYIKLITYTNASVKAWNKRIRDARYGALPSDLANIGVHATLQPIIEGDILFAYNTVTIDRTDILIENSSDYIVKKVQEGTTSAGVDVWVVQLRSVDENIKSEINIVRPEGMQAFLAKFNRLLNVALGMSGQGRKFAWKNYYDFKSQHLLMEDVKDASGKLIAKKDIDYGYAISTHKSQGSTFVNVAVSENNLDTNRNTEERNKLKYVAFSRPTDRAFVLSNKTITE
jgi:ATP-dependent exoDNAse (exonuclease V) alpha subunit